MVNWEFPIPYSKTGLAVDQSDHTICLDSNIIREPYGTYVHVVSRTHRCTYIASAPTHVKPVIPNQGARMTNPFG